MILGHYCPTQTQEVQCPKGKFNPESRSFTNDKCMDCPKDFYCPIGSAIFTSCEDQAEFYCPTGSPDKRTYEQHKILANIDTSDEKCMQSFQKPGFFYYNIGTVLFFLAAKKSVKVPIARRRSRILPSKLHPGSLMPWLWTCLSSRLHFDYFKSWFWFYFEWDLQWRW